MKIGRKPKHYVASNGQVISGLTRRPDGRWRIIGTHQTFREPDEKKAIKIFRQLTETEDKTMGGLVDEFGNTTPEGVTKIHGFTPFRTFEDLWEWVATEIRERPKLTAQKLGIEQIGYLTNLKAPEPLPVAELKQLWESMAKESVRRKVIQSVDEFFAIAKVTDLNDIDNSHVVAYRNWSVKQFENGDWSVKTQSHRYNYLRMFFKFLAEQDKGPEICNKILAYCEKLKPSEPISSYDPKPISREDFHKLLAVANDKERALLLLMLNGAFYIKEAIRVDWSEIDGNKYVGNRMKKGKVIRVAILWDETVKALKKLGTSEGKVIRNANGGSFANVSNAQDLFNRLADRAKVNVTSSQLRDAAFTVAFDIEENLAKLLAGHKFKGKADHYYKRHPETVKKATDAIRKKYLGT